MMKWMMWRRARKVSVVFRRERMEEERLRSFLEGRGEAPEVQGVMEIGERLVWMFVEAARPGPRAMPADEAMARIDAVMELMAQVRAATEPGG